MSSMYPFGGAAARLCMRCGAPLGAKESQCSRCGTYNPLPQGQQFGMSQQGAQGASGPGWGMQAPQAPQFPQAGNAGWPGAMEPSGPGWGSTAQAGGAWPQQNNPFAEQNQQAMPSQPLQQNIFASPNGTGFPGQNQSPFNNSFSTFPQNPNQASPNTFFNATQQQNGFGASSPQNGFGASPWNTLNNPAKPAWMKGQNADDDKGKGKKRPSRGAIAVIVIVLIAVIGGGVFAGYKILKSNHSTPTATTTPAIATPTGTPLFRDTFQNNSAGWDTTQPTGAKITLANNGKLVLESDNNQLFPELLPGGKPYGDFRLDVDAGLTKGNQANGYGVFIRGASTQNSTLGLYYRFEVYGDGSFVVYKGAQDASGKQQDDPLTSVNAPPNKAINPQGQMNHLTIIAKGSLLEFLVNGIAVTSFTDASYKSGTVALFVSNVRNVSGGAQATFQNLAIFPAQ